jgi:nitrogen regulatory protein P-II 2
VQTSFAEYRLAKEIHDLGATGFTFYIVHGVGAKGQRPRHAESANVKIEIICTVEVADKILEHVEKNYFPNYAIIIFVDDVEVLRPEKFGARSPEVKE